MSSKLAEYKPIAFSFPDSLNLFVGQQEHSSTFRSDYGGGLSRKKIVRAHPTDCLTFSSDKLEGSTTLKDAYRPYSGRNYIPTAAARAPTANGEISTVRTTKAVFISARPRTQMGISQKKLEGITSYSYQFGGERSERSDPFRPKSELEGPTGEQSFVSTHGDYGKHNYGRPHLSYIHDTGLFDKCSLGEGTTTENHFPAPPPTKGPNLRPKTGILLGAEKFIPRSSYRKQFDGIKKVFDIST